MRSQFVQNVVKANKKKIVHWSVLSMVGDGIYKKGVKGRQKNHHLNNKIYIIMKDNEVIAPK
jgi:pyruvate/2-oxoacid:ferredoxin oxidoreductase beta subunit